MIHNLNATVCRVASRLCDAGDVFRSQSAVHGAGLIIAICCGMSSLYADDMTFGIGEEQFTMEFVTIGNPGNEHDAVLNFEIPLRGAVPYIYQMGKYEISRAMLEKANAASHMDGTGGGLGLPLADFSDDPSFEPFRPSQAALSVSWDMAARFVNWMNISTGFAPAYKFLTQPGNMNYDIYENVTLLQAGEPGYNPDNPMRSSLARYVIPSLDEWHKAAFHDAEAGTAGIYFRYATGSDEVPIPVASSNEAGTVVYDQPIPQGPADITQAGGPSSYGTVGQQGNVAEWIETYPRARNGFAYVLGAGWPSNEPGLTTTQRAVPPNRANIIDGFRVAMLPDVAPLPIGDFGMDTELNASDIDLLSAQVMQGISTPRFDLTGDGLVDQADRIYWVEELAVTSFGDADLNGTVEFADFLQLSANFNQPTGWGGGDFDGNGMAEFADFLLLADNFGHTRDVSAVPEPGGLLLGLLGICCLGQMRRGR